jgi:hypothetical protein
MSTVAQNGVPDIHDDSPWPEAPEQTHAERATFRKAVAEWAARAKAKLPVAVNGRLERATKLVLQHDVLFLGDGTVEVGSSSDPMKVYHLRGRTCQCQDFTSGKAPEGWCQHVIAACIAKRVEQVRAHQGQTPPATEVPVPAPEPEPELPATEVVQGIDPKFIVWIQSRPFVRHSGLLKLAHERGLQSLTVEWTHNDPELSLAHAVAVFQDGRRFEESGDSALGNVGKKVAHAWRRMSLTRASARALRLALGCDLVAVEELMEND